MLNRALYVRFQSEYVSLPHHYFYMTGGQQRQRQQQVLFFETAECAEALSYCRPCLGNGGGNETKICHMVGLCVSPRSHLLSEVHWHGPGMHRDEKASALCLCALFTVSMTTSHVSSLSSELYNRRSITSSYYTSMSDKSSPICTWEIRPCTHILCMGFYSEVSLLPFPSRRQCLSEKFGYDQSLYAACVRRLALFTGND